MKVVQDPAARYAYVLNSGSDNISAYRHMNSVTPLIFEGRKYGSPFAVGKGVADMVVEPTGRYAYVANAGDGDISAFHVHHKTGALSPVPGSPFELGARPLALAVHPRGQILYAAHEMPAGISIIPIESRFGALGDVAASVSLSVSPNALYLDAQAKELYVLADEGRFVKRFSLQQNGMKLVPISEQRLSHRIIDLVPLAVSEE
jgi:DNA-binding beta-propeller fold protein YncE